MCVLRRLKLWFILLGTTLTLVTAMHALRERAESAHEHSMHGALVSCVVTLALVGAGLGLRLLRPPRLRTAPPAARRLVFAISAPPAVRVVWTARSSPAWLGRFLR